MTDINKAAKRNLDEQQCAARIESEHRAHVYLHQLDENEISRAMIDKMVSVVAEGLATGRTDLRPLLYCAYREARKLQKKQQRST